MSAWRVGIESARTAQRVDDADLPTSFGTGTGDAEPSVSATDEGRVQETIDRLTKWIPGDALALYVAAVTAFAAAERARPSPILLVVFVFLAAGFTIGAAFASTGEVPKEVWLPAILAAVAFAIWSLSVPFSGWQRWSFVNDNQAGVAIVAAVAGVLFGYVADGFTKRAARR